MSKKLIIKVVCCGLLMIPLRADTNWVASQTKTFATQVGAAAQALVTGDPATLINTQSVCVGITCNHGGDPSPPGQYSWASSILHMGDCESGLRVVASTMHFFNNGSDTGSMPSGDYHDCELVPH